MSAAHGEPYPPEVSAALAALSHIRYVTSPTVAVSGDTLKSWDGRRPDIYEARMAEAACELLTAYFRASRFELCDDDDEAGECSDE